MTDSWQKRLVGGFADPAPAPLASARHLRRFLYIAIGIGLGMLCRRNGLPLGRSPREFLCMSG